MTRATPLYVLGFAVAASVAVHVGAIGLLESFARAAWRVVAPAEDALPMLSVTLVEAAPPIPPAQPAPSEAVAPPRATPPTQAPLRPAVGGVSKGAVIGGTTVVKLPSREAAPLEPPVAMPSAPVVPLPGASVAVPDAPAAQAGAEGEPAPVVTRADAPAAPRGPASAPVRYLSNPAPAYPDSARRDGHEGLTIVEVLVSRTGAPLDVKVATTSGYDALDGAAVAGVKRWQFTPAVRDHETIDARIRIPVRFRLRDGD